MKRGATFIASDLEEFETELENEDDHQADRFPSESRPAIEPGTEEVLTLLDEVLWSRGDHSRPRD